MKIMMAKNQSHLFYNRKLLHIKIDFLSLQKETEQVFVNFKKSFGFQHSHNIFCLK